MSYYIVNQSFVTMVSLLLCSQKPHKRNSVRLAIRKLTYAPEEPAPQPSAEVTKEFMMSAGNLRLEASLDKEVGDIRGWRRVGVGMMRID